MTASSSTSPGDAKRIDVGASNGSALGSSRDEDDLLEAILKSRAGAYDPWRDLGRRVGVNITWHQGRVSGWERPLGVTDFHELSITLLVGQSGRQLRSTLAHELIHLERGPITAKRLAPEERMVNLRAAKRLIDPTLFDILAGCFGSPTHARVLACLDVDRWTATTYANWRKRASRQTAERTFAEARKPAAWPPIWLRDCASRYQVAARLAGVTT